jgi:hypothetical protein
MLKRTDVDYYLKGSVGYTGHGMAMRTATKLLGNKERPDSVFQSGNRLLSLDRFSEPNFLSRVSRQFAACLASLSETRKNGKRIALERSVQHHGVESK